MVITVRNNTGNLMHLVMVSGIKLEEGLYS